MWTLTPVLFWEALLSWTLSGFSLFLFLMLLRAAFKENAKPWLLLIGAIALAWCVWGSDYLWYRQYSRPVTFETTTEDRTINYTPPSKLRMAGELPTYR